ncbi:hypothetical protein F2Q68_00007975 [Brassica cretica]|uniref:Uncharacterized protein n=1 Tax=Brassica cretica TaxID=69181 RepID=A0A8S9KWL7_BRACR|nr:hypothetical protein F2Q68_00007975 [Brassica cretica]
MAKKKKPKTSTGGSPTGSAASSALSDSSSNSSTPASSDSAVKTTSEEVKSPPAPASSDSAAKMTSDEVKSPPAPASSDPAVKSNSDEVKSSPISAPASSDPAVVSTSDKFKSLPISAPASTSPDPAAKSTSSSDKVTSPPVAAQSDQLTVIAQADQHNTCVSERENVISSASQTKVAETTATECDANPNSQIPPTSNGVPEVTDPGTLPSLQPATSSAEAAVLAETSGPVTTSDTTKASHLPLVDTPSGSAPSEFQINAYVWREKAKLRSSKLDPEGTPFILESGEPCVRIPNSVSDEFCSQNMLSECRRKFVRMWFIGIRQKVVGNSDEIPTNFFFRQNDTGDHFRQKFVKLSLFRRTSDDFVPVKSNSDEVKSSPISAPASSDPAVVSTSDKVKSLPISAPASTSPDPAAKSTSSSDKVTSPPVAAQSDQLTVVAQADQHNTSVSERENVISSAPQTKVAETTTTECDANPNSQIPPTSNGVPEVTDPGTLPSLQPATSSAEAAVLAETSGPVTTSDTTKASHLPLVDTPSVSAPSEFQINAYVWREKAKLRSSKLDPEGTPFILESGEPCVRIPNSVIEKNQAFPATVFGLRV